MLKINKKPFKKIAILFFVSTLLISAAYLIITYLDSPKEIENLEEYTFIQAVKEKNELVKKISSLTLLPEDEDPVLATITDIYSLKDQKFYNRAANGDKILIYKNAKRAVLFRPSINKVIENALISINEDVSINTPELTTSESFALESTNTEAGESLRDKPAKVAIHNGTVTTGLAKRVSNFLMDKYKNNELEINELTNAQDLFDNTIIVDVTNKFPELKNELIESLFAQEQNVPEAEEIKNVDILIIIGKDFSPTNIF